MKRRMLLLLLMLCLLPGCAKQDAEPTPSPSAAPTATPAVEEEPAPEAEEPPAEDVIPIDPMLYTFTDCRYPLLEHEDCTIEVVFARDSYGEANVLLYAQNHTANKLSVEVEDILLNGTVQGDDDVFFDVPANGTYRYRYLTDTVLACAMMGYDNLESMRAYVELRAGDENNGPFGCEAEFPDGVRVHNAYTAFRDMRADRQVLRSDDAVLIALLGCGDFFDGLLTGYLWIENRGTEEIPTRVSGISLNGVSVPILSIAQTLAPGAGCVMRFTVSERDADTAGVQSIGSLALQILSSEDENTAARSAEGGRWYPVALAQSGQAETAGADGRLLYDDGLLRLTLQKVERKKSATDSTVAGYYYVKVENLRSEGVSLRILDPRIGEEPYVNAKYGDSYLEKQNTKFGAESAGVMVLRADFTVTEAENGLPAFSCIFQVQSQGGDSIFYTIAERIVLTENEEEP